MNYKGKRMKDGRVQIIKEFKNGDSIRVYPKQDGTYNPHIYFTKLSKGKQSLLKELGMNVSKAGYAKDEQIQVSFKKNVVKSFESAVDRARSLEVVYDMLY